jgi:hypothetical protein
MLILAEGTVHAALPEPDKAAMQAWLGPMVDAGMLQSGFLDTTASHVWMILTADDLDSANRRLDDLPAVRSGQVSFTTRPVTALRFS